MQGKYHKKKIKKKCVYTFKMEKAKKFKRYDGISGAKIE